jgi:hypothetical protein
MGFEDRTTFTVAGDRSSFKGISLTKTNTSTEGTWLSTSSYNVLIKPSTAPGPAPTCSTAGKSSQFERILT